jgi:hypothetical protein
MINCFTIYWLCKHPILTPSDEFLLAFVYFGIPIIVGLFLWAYNTNAKPDILLDTPGLETDYPLAKSAHKGIYSGSEVADMMKASYKAGASVKNIDLKELQSVLHNVQQVMAGYSNDDTWSNYDRQAHKKLIEMQYKIDAEITNVKPI